MRQDTEWLNLAVDAARQAGQSLLATFGSLQAIEKKGDDSNVVTAADRRSEAMIVESIRRRFPGHSIIAEETGCDLRDSDITWVIDPLDGTSNYAAGIPWFGVLIAVLRHGVPIIGVMHMPATGEVYSAVAGAGAHRNAGRIAVTCERALSDVLWAYGMDGGGTDDEAAMNVRLLAPLTRRTRNVRATNCLVDAAYTADGRLGGMLNQSTRLWDIAAPMLIVQEAGGLYTSLRGEPLELDVSSLAASKVYAVLAGAPALHRQVVKIVNDTIGQGR